MKYFGSERGDKGIQGNSTGLFSFISQVIVKQTNILSAAKSSYHLAGQLGPSGEKDCLLGQTVPVQKPL